MDLTTKINNLQSNLFYFHLIFIFYLPVFAKVHKLLRITNFTTNFKLILCIDTIINSIPKNFLMQLPFYTQKYNLVLKTYFILLQNRGRQLFCQIPINIYDTTMGRI